MKKLALLAALLFVVPTSVFAGTITTKTYNPKTRTYTVTIRQTVDPPRQVRVDSRGYPKLPNDVSCNGYGCYKNSYSDNGYRYKTPTYRDQYGTYYIGNDQRLKQNIRSDYRRGLSNYRVYGDPGTYDDEDEDSDEDEE